MSLQVYIFFLISSILLRNICVCDEVSFFGNSHITIPLRDDSDVTDIRIQFKTNVAHGVLFCASGTSDYMLISLINSNLDLRVNLGSGRLKLSSVSLQLADLQWHSVYVHHTRDQLMLVVDGQHVFKRNITGDKRELNVNTVSLGGVPQLMHARLNGPFFRGCIRHPRFGRYLLFTHAKSKNASFSQYKVRWGCAVQEFEAPVTSAITLLPNTSFASFTSFLYGGRLSFEIRTRSKKGLVLFNGVRLRRPSGFSTNFKRNHYVALEILEGMLHLALRRFYDNMTLEMYTDTRIDDGQWHRIFINIDRGQVTLQVDGVPDHRIIPETGTHAFDLSCPVFLGGLDPQAIEEAGSLGYHGSTSSIAGCLREIRANDKPRGFPQMIASENLRVGCLWTFPCAAKPCVEGGRCIENGLSEYQCQCPLDRPNCRQLPLDQRASDIERLLTTEPVRVNESGVAYITPSNIRLAANWTRLKLKPDQIEFEIVIPPKHGTIEIRSRPSESNSRFTMRNLAERDVEYRHNGAENQSDFTELRIRFLSSSNIDSPYKSRGRMTFVLAIIVFPRNDQPQVKFPNGAEASIVIHGRLTISRRIFLAVDPEEAPTGLRWIVSYETGVSPSTSGFFVSGDQPTERIHTFSQESINQGHVQFVNRGASTDVIRVRIHDGHAYSPNAEFVFRGVDIPLKVGKNSGLFVRPGGEAMITRHNLSIVANNDSTAGLVRFEVRQKASFGILQAYNYDKEAWDAVRFFTQKQINDGHVKFVGIVVQQDSYTNFNDKFSFVVSTSLKETKEREFKITFTPVIIDVIKNRQLELFGSSGMVATITSDHLFSKTRNTNDGPKSIMYVITQKPKQGYVFLQTNGKRQFLGLRSKFTQADVNSGLLRYWFRRVTLKALEDKFRFVVKVVGGVSQTYEFNIIYRPKVRGFEVINRGLNEIEEGGNATITANMLWMMTSHGHKFEFSVLVPPRHGELVLIDPREKTIVQRSVKRFSDGDIRSKLLVYQHDGGESTLDEFRFKVEPPITDISGKTISKEGVFRIHITLVNDNVPEIIRSGPLNMTLNSTKMLGPEILEAVDKDSDFDNEKLLYTWNRNAIRNGYFFKGHDPRPERFTQGDVNRGIIGFHHSGPSRARFSLTVSDGPHSTQTYLTVVALPAHLYITDKRPIEVSAGGMKDIKFILKCHEHFPPKEVVITVEKLPEYGELALIERNREGKVIRQKKGVMELNYDDVIVRRLHYVHTSSSDVTQDVFNLVFRYRGAHLLEHFYVIIRHHKRLRLVNNKPFTLSDGETVVFSPDHLKVERSKVDSRQIVYTIRSEPKMGRIYVRGSQNTVSRFRQFDVDRGVVEYRHDGGRMSDQVLLDVGDGEQSIEGVLVSFHVRTMKLELYAQNLTLVNHSIPLRSANIQARLNGKPLERNLNFQLVGTPKYGNIYFKRKKTSLENFSSTDLLSGEIIYRLTRPFKNQSDNIDRIEMIAYHTKTGAQTLARLNIYIRIVTEKQAPTIIRNKGMDIWTKSALPISPEDLSAQDIDTKDTLIQFQILDTSNGFVAYASNTGKSITSFTQHDINQENVIFNHSERDPTVPTGFKFRLFDGTHRSIPYFFNVRPRVLKLRAANVMRLEMLPDMDQTITSQHLLVRTNDPHQREEIRYHVRTQPSFGQLILLPVKPGSVQIDAESFTQKQINASLLIFRHESHKAKPQGLVITGRLARIRLEVMSPFCQSLTLEFPILVSLDSVNRFNQRIVLLTHPVAVKEGGTANISLRNLDPSALEKRTRQYETNHVKFVAARLPRHGVIRFNGINFTRGQVFIHDDLKRNRLSYVHDGSDTLLDKFEFQVRIGSPNKARIKSGLDTRQNAVLEINITAVNDQNFHLVQRHPSLRMVSMGAVVINDSSLRVVDMDTKPSRLVFTIMKAPTLGKLYVNSNLCHVNCSFSQADVNAGRLKYVNKQRGASDTFSFDISDGTHQPLHQIFTLYLRPIKVTLRTSTLFVIQNRSEAVLTPAHIYVKSNFPNDSLWLNVTRRPKHGNLFVEANQVNSFSVGEVYKGRLRYIMGKQDEPGDSLTLVAFSTSHGERSKPNVLKIRVKLTLISVSPLTVAEGQTVVITERNVNSAQLFHKTGRMPRFSLRKKPMFGHVLLVGEGYREYNQLSFTRDDIVNRKVKYRAHHVYADMGKLVDRLRLVVRSGSGFRPMHFELQVSVIPVPGRAIVPSSPSPLRTGSVMNIPLVTQDPNAEDSETSHYPRFNVELFTVIISCIAVICIAIIVVIIVHIVRRHRRRAEARAAALTANSITGTLTAAGLRARVSVGSTSAASNCAIACGAELEEVKALTKPVLNGGARARSQQSLTGSLGRSRAVSNKLYLGTMAQLLQSGLPEEDEEEEDESSEEEHSTKSRRVGRSGEQTDTLRRVPEPLLRSTKHWV